jgi:beta-N-acetylhexosaminidase
MLGLQGLELSAEEKDMLKHPTVGGVILFTRNYQSPEQMVDLVQSMRILRQPRLLIAVDQEGGRVQRFREGFTPLPAVRRLGEIYDVSRKRAKQLAYITGWLMATELRAVGVDISFAPVLDLDLGLSGVIGDRSFHHNPEVVADLAYAYMSGMQKAGMEAVGKHFPGHGSVMADSHVELPVDKRTFVDLAARDLLVFKRLISQGIAGIMPAHIVYSCIDEFCPAGFSSLWLKEILRKRLGFQGAIFSDDLDMAGACIAGSPLERAQAALTAGCDVALACNDRQAAAIILDGLKNSADDKTQLRLMHLYGRGRLTFEQIRGSKDWKRAVSLVHRYAAFSPSARDQ